jgi:small subunit ribosomal protein S3
LGQKVNPISFRLGINKNWDSRWFATKEYSNYILEDFRIRKHLKEKVAQAGVSKIEIERAADKIRIRMHVARPGIVIGKKGSEIEKLKKDLESKIRREVIIDIQEVRKAEVEAQLVAENVALQLVRRMAFRRVMKKAVGSALRLGAQGIKISCSGRLGGAEMARREWFREGRVPLHTIRADIDYGFAEAFTTYGVIGVKVIIFKGEILPDRKKNE